MGIVGERYLGALHGEGDGVSQPVATPRFSTPRLIRKTLSGVESIRCKGAGRPLGAPPRVHCCLPFDSTIDAVQSRGVAKLTTARVFGAFHGVGP